MKIVRDYPPNIADIKLAFGAKAIQNAVFTYGDTCYMPTGGEMPGHLEAHELVHTRQQKDPRYWWDRYLADPQFRLEQELEAYQAQYQYAVVNCNRAERRRLLKKISKDFASPLYGRLLNEEEAVQLITK